MSDNLENDGNLKSILLKNNASQVVAFILQEDKVDYKATLIIMLESMTCEEIEESLSEINSVDKNKFEELLEASKELSICEKDSNECSYGFKTEIENSFFILYTVAKNSLSTGDLTAFLIKHYFYYNNKINRILKPAINNLLQEIVLYLKQTIPLLRREIDGQLFLPISRAIFVFFLYDKTEAYNKFKNIIRKDLDFKDWSMFELEYFETVSRFFEKIGLDYIPKIDTVSGQFDIILTEESSSITKTEIFDKINKDDFFNRKIPLLNYQPQKLINPKTDIIKLEEFKVIISCMFKDFYYNTHTHKLNFDLGKVFIENITNPYPNYSEDVLIRTREILKEMFLKDTGFKFVFFGFIYFTKENYLKKWPTKFPELLEAYLGKLNSFSESSNKKNINKIIKKSGGFKLSDIQKYSNMYSVYLVD